MDSLCHIFFHFHKQVCVYFAKWIFILYCSWESRFKIFEQYVVVQGSVQCEVVQRRHSNTLRHSVFSHGVSAWVSFQLAGIFKLQFAWILKCDCVNAQMMAGALPVKASITNQLVIINRKCGIRFLIDGWDLETSNSFSWKGGPDYGLTVWQLCMIV